MSLHGNGSYLETSEGNVYYEVEGSGPFVLLASGGPGVGHAHYHPWFSALASENTVVYLDQLGTGRSQRLGDPSRYTVKLYADTIEALREHLDIEQIALIGISFGGIPATAYAVRHPRRLRRLVLSNAHVSAASWQEGNIDSVNRALRDQFPETWHEITALRASGVRSSAAEYQELVARALPDLEWVDPWGHPRLSGTDDPSDSLEMSVYLAFVGDDPEWQVTGTLAGYDPLPHLSRLEAPTLVVSGRYDRLTLPRLADATYSALPDDASSLVVFERSAHRPWTEESEDYFQIVGAFLR